MLRHELADGYALRLLEEGDAGELFRVIDANREALAEWVEWASTDRTVETTLAFIRATRRQIADNDGLQTAVVDPGGAIVGVVGVHHLDWANGKTSIGYWLARDAQGRGVMTAAVRAYVDYAFTMLGLHRVEIEAAVENVRSRAIPQRLGFREEGIRRQVERVGERRLDRVVYAVLADEWPGA